MPAIHPPTVQNHSEYIVYVGTYSPAIQAFRFRIADGSMEALGSVGELQNPSFLAVDRQKQHLYAVSELDGEVDGKVASFRIDSRSGRLTKLNEQDSAGVAPCHLAIDENAHRLLVANYGTGGVSVFSLTSDGSLGTLSQVLKAEGSGPNHKRQSGPHAHEVVLSVDGQNAFVPDLGIDQIRVYGLQNNISPKGAVHLPPGTGPRHLSFTRDQHFAFVFGELKTNVTVLQRDTATEFSPLQVINSLPADAEGGAEILLDHAGRFLYTSNRDVTTGGPGSITVFSVNAKTGHLDQVDRIATAGSMPRGVEFDPSGKFMLVGDQKKNLIQVFKIDPNTGRLSSIEKTYPAPSPVSFAFVPAS